MSKFPVYFRKFLDFFECFESKPSCQFTERGQNSKHKKPFISAPERPRTVLNTFLECMYMAGTKITSFYRNFRKCSKITKMTTCFGQWFRTYLLTSFAKNFGTFLAFREGTPVDKEGRYKNVPKYLCFGFWLSLYIFPKLLKFPKALSKRMALLGTLKLAS